MLPLHRDAATTPAGGWREMPIESAKARRLLRLRFRFSRVTCLLTLAALLAFAWLFTNFLHEPPFRPPHFLHGGPDRPPPDFWPPPPPHPFDNAEEEDKPQVENEEPKVDWNGRAELVKQAFVHAYHGYEEYAAPKDELLPISNRSVNKCVARFHLNGSH